MTVHGSAGGASDGWLLLVHGGAGAVAPERRPAHERGCRVAAELGARLLAGGGSVLDAVQAAVRSLEDQPGFNAGTGASLTRAGTLELDAAIMAGDLRCGGVCGLPPHRNPISVARAVLEAGEHVLYQGAGAAAFAREAGFEPADPSDMITVAARERLARALAAGRASSWAGGTVGAVARDARGRVAAATSTGGTAGKRPGRVGDSPIPGAGTYADDLAGAASATGDGEGMLRVVLCHEAVCALRDGTAPVDVARRVLAVTERRASARGGLILVDRSGRYGWARTTETMSWAAATPAGVQSGT